MTTTLQPSQFDQSFGVSAARMADALREFDERVEAGEEPMAVADDVVVRAKNFSLSDFTGANLLLPRFAVGNRQNLDLPATMARLREAAERREISMEELDRQLDLIEAWGQIIDAREARRAAP